MALGRPMKGATRRIPITIHTTADIIAAIDAYTGERRLDGEKAYSRSDFWNEAAESLLQSLGRLPQEAEKPQICAR